MLVDTVVCVLGMLFLELVGCLLIVYGVFGLLGVDLVYVVRLVLSKRERRWYERVRAYVCDVLPYRVGLVTELLGVDPVVEPPRAVLRPRKAGRPGGLYVWSLKAVVVDVPRRLEDILPVLDHELVHHLQNVVLGLRPWNAPTWLLEGMAAAVELALYGRVRGYEKHLSKYLEYCRSGVDPRVCPPRLLRRVGLVSVKIGGVEEDSARGRKAV